VARGSGTPYSDNARQKTCQADLEGACESREEIDSAFAKLSADGQVFMPLDDSGFSARFGWCSDRFGVSWQLISREAFL
jgi:predicted 3-demethylubiquinone-9 3-methyltransferase (glyoxalase superfamily)